MSVLLSYQENCVGKKLLSVFPKAAEEHIIGKVDHLSAAYFLHANHQSVFQFFIEFSAYKA